MSLPILDELRRVLGPNLDGIAGAAVSAEIPVTEAVVNRILADRMRTVSGPVTGARVEVLDGDAFVVHVAMRASGFLQMLPPMRVQARIERQPELPHSPVIGVRWSLPSFGPLALLAAPALAHFKALPPGVRVDGDRATIDVGEMLRARGFGDLLPLVRSLRVHTRRGQIVLQFEGGVRPPQNT